MATDPPMEAAVPHELLIGLHVESIQRSLPCPMGLPATRRTTTTTFMTMMKFIAKGFTRVVHKKVKDG